MNVVNYLKLDQTMPDPYGQAIWPPRIEAATPFRSQAEATAAKSRISNAWPEKLVGLNDKDAALAAGYSLSVAKNTKQRIWKPRVRDEWERLLRGNRLSRFMRPLTHLSRRTVTATYES